MEVKLYLQSLNKETNKQNEKINTIDLTEKTKMISEFETKIVQLDMVIEKRYKLFK